MTINQQLEFVVGEEKSLAEIISKSELEPIFRSFFKGGINSVTLLDEDSLPICSVGQDELKLETESVSYPILVEGEPKGELKIEFAPENSALCRELASVIREIVTLLVTSNLKRMLTTEMHTSIVKESYEQLVDSNKRLVLSEARYRELALNLEKKVEQRRDELKQAYTKMLQQEKLASVGTLAAGMAHEINNPNGFVRSNIATFRKYFERMKEALNHIQLLIAANTPLMKLQEEVDTLRKRMKLDFVISDTESLLEQSLNGCDRIAAIVASLKSFSHVDETGDADADINFELKNIIVVTESQLPSNSSIETDFVKLPLFPCNPGLLSQAFYNIIRNSIQSKDSDLKISISTMFADNKIIIKFTDNGCGISKENLPKIFDPFFTTKDVGKGTGMGLTIVKDIVEKYNGTIEFDSEIGIGTVVIIKLELAK